MLKREAILRPLGVATLLAVGLGVIITIVVLWAISVRDHLVKADVMELFYVRYDGVPMIRRATFKPYYSSTYHTLDGKEVSASGDLSWFRLQGAMLPGPRVRPVEFPLPAVNRAVAFSDYQDPPTYWYFIHDGQREGRGYFVGYHSKSKRLVGYLGRHGLRSDLPPAEDQFPVDGRKMLYGSAFSGEGRNPEFLYFSSSDEDRFLRKIHLISDDEIVGIDLRAGSVGTLLRSPHLLSLGTVVMPLATGQKPDPLAHRPQFLAVRADDRLLVFDENKKLHHTYRIPKEVRNREITFYEIGNQKALLYSRRRLPDHSQRYDLYWIDEAGDVLQQRELALAYPGSEPYNEVADGWKNALAGPEPVAMALAAFAAGPGYHLAEEVEPDYASALRRSLTARWPSLLAVTVLGTVLGWLAFRRQQRFALPWGGVWAGFVFLGGVPAWVAYRCHRRWPVLKACPACGHDTPRDRDACAQCGKEFPGPEREGIEVFA